MSANTTDPHLDWRLANLEDHHPLFHVTTLPISEDILDRARTEVATSKLDV